MTLHAWRESPVNMVDCGSARCFQERRSFKKELLSWNKKVPLIVGLEEVAKELLGTKKIEILLTPFNDLEGHSGSDWQASMQCTFCDASSSHCAPANSNGLTEDADDTASALRYLQALVPFACPPSLLSTTRPGQEEGRPLDLSASTNHKPGDSSDSAYTKPPCPLKVPQIFTNKNKKKDGWKRAYTDEELTAALSDIRSGKLGTRRAAVLYGIPRSTLRNKMYKVDGEEALNGFDAQLLQDNKLCMGDLLQGGMGFYGMAPFGLRSDDHIGQLAESDWERKLEQIRRKHNLLEPNRKFGVTPLCGFEAEEEEERDWRYMMNPYVGGAMRGMPFLPDLVRKMAEERMEQDRIHRLRLDAMVNEEQEEELDLRTNIKRESSPYDGGLHSSANSSGSSSPPVELKIPSYKPIKSLYEHAGFPMMPFPDSSLMYPPSAHQQAGNAFKIGETLKDIIAKTIAEKVRTRVGYVGQGPYATEFNGTAFEKFYPVHNGTPEPAVKKPKMETSEKPMVSNNDKNQAKTNGKTDENPGDGSQAAAPPKKTRPKRGQYRKYNSQLLLEAVRAVQRGEMSVHRAGSYFGVPHSTLEYKVKERHLLRQRKPRENRKKTAEVTSTSTADLPSSVSSTNGASMCSTTLPGNPMPTASQATAMSTMAALAHQSSLAAGMGFPTPFPMALAWAQPAAMPFPAQHDPTMAAFSPGGFGLNTSASELLKKLQQKVQAKAMASQEDDMPSLVPKTPMTILEDDVPRLVPTPLSPTSDMSFQESQSPVRNDTPNGYQSDIEITAQ